MRIKILLGIFINSFWSTQEKPSQYKNLFIKNDIFLKKFMAILEKLKHETGYFIYHYIKKNNFNYPKIFIDTYLYLQLLNCIDISFEEKPYQDWYHEIKNELNKWKTQAFEIYNEYLDQLDPLKINDLEELKKMYGHIYSIKEIFHMLFFAQYSHLNQIINNEKYFFLSKDSKEIVNIKHEFILDYLARWEVVINENKNLPHIKEYLDINHKIQKVDEKIIKKLNEILEEDLKNLKNSAISMKTGLSNIIDYMTNYFIILQKYDKIFDGIWCDYFDIIGDYLNNKKYPVMYIDYFVKNIDNFYEKRKNKLFKETTDYLINTIEQLRCLQQNIVIGIKIIFDIQKEIIENLSNKVILMDKEELDKLKISYYILYIIFFGVNINNFGIYKQYKELIINSNYDKFYEIFHQNGLSQFGNLLEKKDYEKFLENDKKIYELLKKLN